VTNIPRLALTAVASPVGGPDETFRIAGLTDPRVVVPTGARVTVQVVNADPDTAHGLVITASQPGPFVVEADDDGQTGVFPDRRCGSLATRRPRGCTPAR